MKATPTKLAGVLAIEPRVFGDERGFFFESFNQRAFDEVLGMDAENKKQMWVPPGFAHGFLTLSDTAEFLYKTTDYYSPEHERCIHCDDAVIGVEWPLITQPLVSGKDKSGANFAEYDAV